MAFCLNVIPGKVCTQLLPYPKWLWLHCSSVFCLFFIPFLSSVDGMGKWNVCLIPKTLPVKLVPDLILIEEAFPTLVLSHLSISKLQCLLWHLCMGTTNTGALILANEIIPRFGMPLQLDSDQGIRFTGSVLGACRLLGIKQRFQFPIPPTKLRNGMKN